jgi:polysaccharide export outer membrane protein
MRQQGRLRLRTTRTTLMVGVALLALAGMRTAGAQVRPPTRQDSLSLQLLDARQVRERIQRSGLTPQQIRDRLQARGMSSTLLDPYLAGVAVGDAGQAVVPGRDVLAAVAVLAEVDKAALEAATRPDSMRFEVPKVTTINGAPVFGLNLFARGTNQFEPNAAGPVDANYKLGPLDVVVVILTGQVELAHTLEVTRDGFIVIPQVGQVFVANLPLEQATNVIVERLRASYRGAGVGANAPTRVYVSVARLRSNQVFVVGEVNAPGSYQVSGAGTALTALYAAGGPTVSGTMRAIEVRRSGKSVSTVDLYDYLLRGDNSRDVRLENGDVVFVRSVGRHVQIVGEVVRPGIYELKAEDTLGELIAMAGGFNPTASQRIVQISRVLSPDQRAGAGHERAVVDVDSAAIRSSARVALQAGDSVTVFEVSRRVRNRVTVTGGVWAPGTFAFRQGMRLRDALVAAGGMRDDALRTEVQISRRTPDERRELVRVLLAATGDAANPLLSDEDEVHVFPMSDFRSDRYVQIGGAVRRATSIPWTEGMTLRSLILAAGGLHESALLTEVEIGRFPVSRTGGELATVFRAPLDSTYLIDRDETGRYLGPPGLSGRAGGAPEVVLQPYDQVNVLRQPEWDLGGQIRLGGEVKYPGAYAIRTKGERISDVIARAGGLTDQAFTLGAIFRRAVDSAVLAERKRALDHALLDRSYGITLEKLQVAALPGGAQTGVESLGSEQSRALAAALTTGDAGSERVEIDLDAILRNANTSTNFIVRAGDQLIVPQREYSVAVRGMVGSPTSLAYAQGASVKHYVVRSGGVTSNGDLKRSFVVQPNGRVEAYSQRRFWPDRVPTPLAGATIIVPPREGEVRVPNTSLPLIISAIGSLTTAIVAIVSMSR